MEKMNMVVGMLAIGVRTKDGSAVGVGLGVEDKERWGL